MKLRIWMLATLPVLLVQAFALLIGVLWLSRTVMICGLVPVGPLFECVWMFFVMTSWPGSVSVCFSAKHLT